MLKESLIAPFIRLVIGSGLVSIFTFRLLNVFVEPSDNGKFFAVSVFTDCADTVYFNETWDVSADGNATLDLSIQPEDHAFSRRCETISVALPGLVKSVAIFDPAFGGDSPLSQNDFRPSKPFVPLPPGYSEYRFNLAQLSERDPVLARYQMNRVGLRIQVAVPDFLILRSYSGRLLNLRTNCTPGLLPHRLHAGGGIGKCNISGRINFDKVIQITSDASKYKLEFPPDGSTFLYMSGSQISREDYIFLQDESKVRKRDVEMVFSGALMATGIAILADFCIDVASLFSNTRENGKPLAENSGLNPHVERARRRLAWRRKAFRRRDGDGCRNRPGFSRRKHNDDCS